jgi:TonB family protein
MKPLHFSHFSISVCLTLLLLSVSSIAQERGLTIEPATGRRVALVIGNGAYPTAPLKNPVNDAQDVAAALRDFGFEVLYRENVDQTNMKRAIREFGARIRGGGIGLFYYAGHGVQVKGINYLVPVDAQIETEEEIEYETVDAGFVLAQMESSRTSVNIVILDACRNNPFARSFRSSSDGLAQMDAPSGTLIAYATAPGSVARDNARGRNGLYTQELLKVMATPNLSIEEVFKRVRISVRSLTQNRQTPWESSSLTGNFTFAVKSTTDERVFLNSEADVPARIASLPKPGYTEVGRMNQIEGVVKLEVVFLASGEIGEIKVLAGLPDGLTEKAIQAAQQVKFTPAMKDGRAVSVRTNLEYTFKVY